MITRGFQSLHFSATLDILNCMISQLVGLRERTIFSYITMGPALFYFLLYHPHNNIWRPISFLWNT